MRDWYVTSHTDKVYSHTNFLPFSDMLCFRSSCCDFAAPPSWKFTILISKVKVKSLSRAWLFATPWIVACTKLLCPWDFQGKSTEVGCHFLLHGIFPTQGLNPGLSHCRQMLYRLSHQGSPLISKYNPKQLSSFNRCDMFFHTCMSLNSVYSLPGMPLF